MTTTLLDVLNGRLYFDDEYRNVPAIQDIIERGDNIVCTKTHMNFDAAYIDIKAGDRFKLKVTPTGYVRLYNDTNQVMLHHVDKRIFSLNTEDDEP